MKVPELRPRQPLLGVAFAAVLGIIFADRFAVPLAAVLGITAFALIFVFWRPRTWSCWLLTALAFFTLHTLRHRGNEARRLAENFADGSHVVRATGIVWSAPKAPKFWSRTITAQFRLKLETLEIGGALLPAKSLINVEWAGRMPAYGDRVAFTATARNLEPARNPGQFDFTRHLQRQGIFSELEARFPRDCRIVDHGHGWKVQVFAQAAQRWIRERLELDLEDSPEITALIASMVLGLTGETPDDVKEMFQRTGTLHLFAVSGLNVAMLGTLAWFVLKPLRIGRKLSVFAIIPILVGYALVTGLSASCVRATIMGALILAAFLVERPAVVYNSLAAAGLGILAWDTNQLFSAGFQFSFVLVFTIVWLAARIQRRCEPFGRPDAFLPRALWNWRQRAQTFAWKGFAGAVGVTLSAWLGSLIFTAGYFHLFSLSAIFANLCAVPLAFAVLGLGLAATVTAGFSTAGAMLFNNANWVCAKLLLLVVKGFAALPGGHIYVEVPGLKKAPEVELTILDLQSGAATHLRTERRDWLLDCGHSAHYAPTVLPYLRSRGVNRLDGLLLSHGDAQHLGSALELRHDFAPRTIVDSAVKGRARGARRELHTELVAQQIGRSLCERGDVISLSPQTRLRVLFPPPGWVRTSADDNALVVRIEHGQWRALFTSDSGFCTEQWLVQNECDLRADLLVKGQHAKDFSGTSEFLARVQPQAIVCSALGFGVPPAALDEWTQRAAARGIAVFRQDQCGAVQVELRDGAWTLRGFVNAQTFRGATKASGP